MKLIINKAHTWLLLIFLSFMDTVTRFSFNDDLSPYRIAAAVMLIFFLPRHLKKYARSLCILFITLVYSTIVIAITGGNMGASIDQFIHVLFVYAIYIAVNELSMDPNTRRRLFSLIDKFTIIEIVVFFFELLTGIILFRSNVSKDKASVFSWGINDFVVSIVFPAVIYIVEFFREGKKTSLLKFMVIFVVAVIAGARASIIVLLFAFIISFFWFVLARHLRGTLTKVISIIGLTTIAVVSLYYINPIIDDVDIRTLVFDPIFNVLSLETSGGVGSIALRTSALIIGINRLIDTFGFGVGLGNINYIIAGYGFNNLRTMHNILMQFVVELGWLMILYIVLILQKVSRDVKVSTKEGAIEFICVLLFPLISAQSSGGVMSCYIMWTCLFYILNYNSRIVY